MIYRAPVQNASLIALFATLEVGLGVVMLAVPEQFSSPIFVGIKDVLALYGSGFVLCGAALLLVALGFVPFTIGTVLVVIAAVPLPLLAWGYVRGGIAYAAGGLLIESITLLAVAAARATGRRLPADRALPVMIGAIQLAFAMSWLLRPDAFTPALLGSFYTRLDLATPSFLIAGLAIVAFTVLDRPRLLVVAAALGIANLLAALVFSAAERHSWTGIVQYTALAAFLVPTAVPGILRLSVGPKIVGAIAIVLAALLLLANEVTTSVIAVRDTQVAVEQGESVIQDGDGLLVAVFDMQNSTRGFVITGDERFLAPYADAFTTARANLVRLRQSAAGDSEAAASIAKLSDEVQALDAYLSRQAANRRSSFELARDQVIAGDGRAALEAFRSDMLAFLGRIRADRDARENLLVQQTLEARSTVVAGASLAAALALSLALYLAIGIGLRTARLRRIAESMTVSSDLERPIPAAPGGDDLDALARSLEAMRLRLRDAFAVAEARAAEARALFESSNDAVLLGNPDGRVLDANAAALALLGRSLEELREGGRGIIVDPTDERHGPAYGLFQRTGRFEGQLRLRRSDGWAFEAEMRIATYPGPLGDERVSFIARDVTERERAAAELRSAKESADGQLSRVNAVMASVEDGIYTVDPTGALVSMNPAAERMLGWAFAELHGRNAHESIHHLCEDGSANPAATCPLLGVLRTGQPVQVNSDVLVRRDGSYLPARLSSAPITTDGQVTGAVVAFSDISLERANAAALEAAKAEADAANQAKSAFLASMSHELRTPLNAVIGFAQLLELDGLPPEQHESVTHISRAGRHLLELINEVLDISRIEAGQMTISPEPVAVADLLHEVVALVGPLASSRSVAIDASAAGCDAHVVADRQRLRQILINLVSNAVKYNRDGGSVALSCLVVPGGRLRISVSDTGYGIPEDQLARLFQPFERLGANLPGIEGTGLGLALSKGLVEAMGGTIGVASELDRGTTFWVELRIVDGPVEKYERGQPTAAVPVAPGTARTRTLLYIEDNAANLKLVERILAHRPAIELITATLGSLGAELACEHRPDLILLDLHLPDVPGDEILRRLQRYPETRNIPVVIVSADATKSQIARMTAEGAAAYLTKPLDVNGLLTLVDRLIGER